MVCKRIKKEKKRKNPFRGWHMLIYLLPKLPNDLMTSTRTMASAATVTINGSQVVAIGLIASTVPFTAREASGYAVTAVDAPKLESTTMPTPMIRPIRTNIKTTL